MYVCFLLLLLVCRYTIISTVVSKNGFRKSVAARSKHHQDERIRDLKIAATWWLRFNVCHFCPQPSGLRNQRFILSVLTWIFSISERDTRAIRKINLIKWFLQLKCRIWDETSPSVIDRRCYGVDEPNEGRRRYRKGGQFPHVRKYARIFFLLLIDEKDKILWYRFTCQYRLNKLFFNRKLWKCYWER